VTPATFRSINSTDMDISELNAQHFAITCLNSLAGSSMNEAHIDDTCNLSADCCQHVNPSRLFKPSILQAFNMSTPHAFNLSFLRMEYWALFNILLSTYQLLRLSAQHCQPISSTDRPIISQCNKFLSRDVHTCRGCIPPFPGDPPVARFSCLTRICFPRGVPPFPG
jgi:hypothetical protein